MITRPELTRALKVTLVTTAVVILATAALAYDRKDAAYVTSSKNGAVLDYIVCLEGVVSETPKKMSSAMSLDKAMKACRVYEKKLPASASEPNAEDIRAMVQECGFNPGDASPDAGCNTPDPATETPPPSVQQKSLSAGHYQLSQTEQIAVQTGVREGL
jgi:hypothetical protein